MPSPQLFYFSRNGNIQFFLPNWFWQVYMLWALLQIVSFKTQIVTTESYSLRSILELAFVHFMFRMFFFSLTSDPNMMMGQTLINWREQFNIINFGIYNCITMYWVRETLLVSYLCLFCCLRVLNHDILSYKQYLITSIHKNVNIMKTLRH
jgi:hypothetical protein